MNHLQDIKTVLQNATIEELQILEKYFSPAPYYREEDKLQNILMKMHKAIVCQMDEF